jgi:hypothetical protein
VIVCNSHPHRLMLLTWLGSLYWTLAPLIRRHISTKHIEAELAS